jgi:hypothetical protein
MSRVFRADVETAEEFDGTLSLPNDLPDLEREIKDAGVVLMLLDPLLSRLDAALVLRLGSH